MNHHDEDYVQLAHEVDVAITTIRVALDHAYHRKDYEEVSKVAKKLSKLADKCKAYMDAPGYQYAGYTQITPTHRAKVDLDD